MADLPRTFTTHDKWVAVSVSVLAGFATMLGGCTLFFVTRFKPLPFCVVLGVAAGVMTWVTLVEIIPTAIESCVQGLHGGSGDPASRTVGNGWLIATACVLGGWVLATGSSYLLECILKSVENNIHFDDKGNVIKAGMGSENPRSSAELEDFIEPSRYALPQVIDMPVSDFDRSDAIKSICQGENGLTKWIYTMSRGIRGPSDVAQAQLAVLRFKTDQRDFLRLGVFTAVALGFHNIPEGMATFASYLQEKKMGFGMAVAIAIHNIPEGMAVAIPVYFGTGSAPKALLLCFVSLLGEIVGAFIQWAIINVQPNYGSNSMGYGITMGFIGGFMGRVAIADLLFGCATYDPNNIVTVRSFTVGGFIMAFSLALLAYFD